MALTLRNTRLITPTTVVDRGTIMVSQDGRIAYAGPTEGAPNDCGKSLDLEALTIVPGFIDIHTHGGAGVAFGAGSDARGELCAYSRWAAGHGVTAFLCSLAATDADALLATVRAYADALDTELPGAQALGIHLEGPFLNPARKGTFPASWLRAPTIEEAERLLRAGGGWIRVVTLAPELPGALAVAAVFRKARVVVAMGHTDADYRTAAEALSGSFSHVTHAYNAIRGLHPREPGALGAVLASGRASAELIADGVHVHPAAMRIILRCLGRNRVTLVTDAVPWAGLPDGDYEWLGQRVHVNGDRATLPDGTLAGSTTTMDACVRNAAAMAGIPLAQAIRMATLNPARALGVDGRMGRLSVGSDANLAVLDANGHVAMTFVRGKRVYSRAPT